MSVIQLRRSRMCSYAPKICRPRSPRLSCHAECRACAADPGRDSQTSTEIQAHRSYQTKRCIVRVRNRITEVENQDLLPTFALTVSCHAECRVCGHVQPRSAITVNRPCSCPSGQKRGLARGADPFRRWPRSDVGRVQEGRIGQDRMRIAQTKQCLK
jgi:hypothetical protein